MRTCKRDNCTRQTDPRAPHGYCRKHAQALGVADTYTDSTPVVGHLNHLIDTGWTYSEIARAAHITHVTAYKLHTTPPKTVRRSTARGILNINPHYLHSRMWAEAWPSQRRLRALQAAGWTQATLATAIGITQSAVSKISNGRLTISRAVANAIEEVWQDLANQPVVGPPTESAARRQWAPPMMWDDIDDPNEHHPNPAVHVEIATKERTLARVIREEYPGSKWPVDCIGASAMSKIARGGTRTTSAAVIDAIYIEADKIRTRRQAVSDAA